MDRRLAFSALLFAAANLFSDEKKELNTKVTGAVTIPKELESFEKQTLELRLYEYDPRLADQSADLIELIEKKDFQHTKGTDTVTKFEIGAKGILKPDRRYYMTVFVLAGKTRTHIAELDGKSGLAKVLTENPGELKFVARPVR